jgi:hypothetical protein
MSTTEADANNDAALLIAELAARIVRAGKLPPPGCPFRSFAPVEPTEAVRVAHSLSRAVLCFKQPGCWSKFRASASRLLDKYVAGVAIRPQIINHEMHEQRGLWFAGEFWAVLEVPRTRTSL